MEVSIPRRLPYGDRGELIVVAGFRPPGAASFFFGQDPAWHFDSRSELRRAFVDGTAYRAEAGILVRLARELDSRRIAFRALALSEREQSELLARSHRDLTSFFDSLSTGDFSVSRRYPEEADSSEGEPDGIDPLDELRLWLAQTLDRGIVIGRRAALS